MNKALLTAMALLVAGCEPAAPPGPTPTEVLKAKEARFQSERSAILASMRAALDEGKFDEAAKIGLPYRSSNDPELLALLEQVREREHKAKVVDLLERVKEAKRNDHAALTLYYGKLTELEPKNEAYRAAWSKHAEANQREINQRRKAAEARDRAERRKRGVSVGMSKQDVLWSSWGRPRKVNSTTTSRGTREQWVYDGGYLYFDERGLLTTIQN